MESEVKKTEKYPSIFEEKNRQQKNDRNTGNGIQAAIEAATTAGKTMTEAAEARGSTRHRNLVGSMGSKADRPLFKCIHFSQQHRINIQS